MKEMVVFGKVLPSKKLIGEQIPFPWIDGER
jgi:hypothetical protein